MAAILSRPQCVKQHTNTCWKAFRWTKEVRTQLLPINSPVANLQRLQWMCGHEKYGNGFIISNNNADLPDGSNVGCFGSVKWDTCFLGINLPLADESDASVESECCKIFVCSVRSSWIWYDFVCEMVQVSRPWFKWASLLNVYPRWILPYYRALLWGLQQPCQKTFKFLYVSVLTRGQYGHRVLSLPASVCPSVCQSLACLCDNSRPVQARITNFKP